MRAKDITPEQRAGIDSVMSGLFKYITGKNAFYYKIDSNGEHQRIGAVRLLRELGLSFYNARNIAGTAPLGEYLKAEPAPKVKKQPKKVIVEEDEDEDKELEEYLETLTSSESKRYCITQTNTGFWGVLDNRSGTEVKFHTMQEALLDRRALQVGERRVRQSWQ